MDGFKVLVTCAWLLALALLGVGVSQRWKQPTSLPSTPTAIVQEEPRSLFLRGQCIRDFSLETWDQRTWKIEQIGKRSYLVREIPYPLFRDQRGLTLSFEHAHTLTRIECPKKG